MPKVKCIGEIIYGPGKNKYSRCIFSEESKECHAEEIKVKEEWDDKGEVHYVCQTFKNRNERPCILFDKKYGVCKYLSMYTGISNWCNGRIGYNPGCPAKDTDEKSLLKEMMENG